MDEITAEYAVLDLVAPAELRVRTRVSVAGKTHMGRVRENNEDKFEFFQAGDDAHAASRGDLYVVADGMGGHEAGQIASELAVNTFIDNYLSHPSTDIATVMRGSAQAANRFVYDVSITVPGRRGMGTTLTAMALIQDQVWIAQVGDSRLYRLRDGALVQVTRDHTWVEDAVAQGMHRSQAESHPYRHVLTRAVGTEANVEVDILTEKPVVGDIYLLCSDGLINHVSDADIQRHLSEKPPGQAAWNLVNAALLDGGTDNCTVLIVRIDGLDSCENG